MILSKMNESSNLESMNRRIIQTKKFATLSALPGSHHEEVGLHRLPHTLLRRSGRSPRPPGPRSLPRQNDEPTNTGKMRVGGVVSWSPAATTGSPGELTEKARLYTIHFAPGSP